MTDKSKIKVLIADNSSYARIVMREILGAEPEIDVVDIASTEEELLLKTRRYKPDVIILDIDIAEKNSLVSFNRVLRDNPATVILSGIESRLSDTGSLHELLEISTNYDVIVKPHDQLQEKLKNIGNELVRKIKKAAWRQDVNSFETLFNNGRLQNKQPSRLIVIGASTGGTLGIEYILGSLSSDFRGAILIAQHMPPGFTASFTRRLNNISDLNVSEAETGMKVTSGSVILSPGDKNMVVKNVLGSGSKIQVAFNEVSDSFDRPSVDELMKSAAECFGEKTLGIILSGLGRDGTAGAKEIRKAGGYVITQDQETSVVYGMAKAAAAEGSVDRVLPLHDIPRFIGYFMTKTI